MLIESVPNVSEGRRLDVIQSIADAVAATPGVRLLDVSPDRSHNRSVYSLAGAEAPVEAAVLALVDQAIASIDLRTHEGVHPRIGAVDVVPFVPLGHTTMETCVALARRVGRDIADRHEIPVFLYGRAAEDAERSTLSVLRRGGLEGLAGRLARREWQPDFGPSRLHPRAGACAVGARQVLIAYNVNLDTNRLDVARTVAAAVRASSGGLPHVQALGVRLPERDLVQVTMNLTDYTKTPMLTAFEAVKREAERLGVRVKESELVGLAPAAALTPAIADAIQLPAFSPSQILERQLDGL